MEQEDNHSLLMMVLKQQFRNKPHVVENAMEIIKQYSSKTDSDKTEYTKTLNTLYDMMIELPSNILLFFLTLVPLPKRDDCPSTIMELMKLTHNSLPENIRPILITYLNDLVPPLVPLINQDDKKEKRIEKTAESSNSVQIKNELDGVFIKPTIKRVRKRKIATEKSPIEITSTSEEKLKKLVELSAEYVIKNLEKLKHNYNNKKIKVWNLLSNDVFNKDSEDLKKCYALIKDLNKKIQLIRMIENENVTAEFIEEEYGNSEIFLKKHKYELLHDPFEVSDKLKNSITYFLKE